MIINIHSTNHTRENIQLKESNLITSNVIANIWWALKFPPGKKRLSYHEQFHILYHDASVIHMQSFSCSLLQLPLLISINPEAAFFVLTANFDCLRCTASQMYEIYIFLYISVCDCELSITLIGHFLWALCPNAFNKSNVNGISTKHYKILHSKLCCNLLLMKIDSHLNKRLPVLLGYFNFHKMSDCLLEI